MFIKRIVLGILLIGLFIGFLIGAYYFAIFIKRKVNYNKVYKPMVEQTVRDMVKPNALKEVTNVIY